MRNQTQVAYEAASKAAYEIVKSVTAEVLRAIKDSEVTDEDQLSDIVHQECDNAIIYSVDQYICVWGLPGEEDAIEEGLSTPKCFLDALAAQAFMNLQSAVNEHHSEFLVALAVAGDAAEEKGEES